MRRVRSGKVRELYELDADHLLLVASDRVSTYDVVLPTPVPDKGRVLTGISAFWFARLDDVVAHHLVTTDVPDLPDGLDRHDLEGRSMVVRRAEVVPYECVVRGHLAGSAWTEYRRDGQVAGTTLPPGLRLADRLPEPIFTPATKAAPGQHDQNVTFAAMAAEIGSALAGRMRELSLTVYDLAAEHAAARGVLLADTKLEFGLVDGDLLLVDEVLTPDSSRYWPAEGWEPGRSPPSFDKQFVRDAVTATGWDRTPPGPELDAEVVAATRRRYVQAYELLTDEPFANWPGGA